MKKQWTVAIVLLALIGLVWQVAAPYYTVYQIKTALKQKQYDQLVHYVDFELLKKNLHVQLQEKLEQRLALTKNNSFFGSLTASMAEQSIEYTLDQTINPHSIPKIMGSLKALQANIAQIDGWVNNVEVEVKAQPELMPKSLKSSLSGLPSHHATGSAQTMPKAEWQYGFDSIRQFSVIQPISSGQSIHYVLTRSGLGWKLSNIVLN
ncbi:MAG: DUF2939 domain-containing protein [Moraxellaceae bacterium]|nr:MAG: DUF2939 domain-containing protein [Moraxellaceae bacterium]